MLRPYDKILAKPVFFGLFLKRILVWNACLANFLSKPRKKVTFKRGNPIVVSEGEFYFMLCIIFAGKVYNLTVLMTNTSFDDFLWFAHSPQFIELRREFELGVSIKLILPVLKTFVCYQLL